MKSYSVKSNAKRFARRLVEVTTVQGQPATFEAVEPVLVQTTGGNEWFPALALVSPIEAAKFGEDEHGHTTFRDEAVVVPNDLLESILGVNEEEPGHADMPPVAMCSECFAAYDANAPKCPICGGSAVPDDDEEPGHDVTAMLGTSPRAELEANELAARSGKLFGHQRDVELPEVMPTPHPDMGKTTVGMPSALRQKQELGRALRPSTPTGAVVIQDIAALAAEKPKASTAEEIAARRAERRQRIEAGAYKEPAPAAKGKKETRADIIMRMVQTAEGSTAADIAEACGWQAHTLRGYIGGTLRKRLAPFGKTIAVVRKSGEPTRYRMADLPTP